MCLQDGDERFDVGLAVRMHAKGMCVPGFAAPTPDGSSWQYSQSMINVLASYKEAHPWLWDGLAAQANSNEASE